MSLRAFLYSNLTLLSSQKNTTIKDLLFLGPLAFFFLLFHLGKGSLASWDEGLYASVAKEIYLSGNWLHLTLSGELWVDKPPLAIWMTAIFYHLFGVGEFSARLFSALCGVGTVLLTYFFGRKLFNRWTALFGALVLLSTLHFIRFARFGMLDAPFTFFMTLSFYLFWLGLNRNRYLVLSGVAIGLAFLTKGFAAVFIFAVIWTYCLCADRLDTLGKSSYWIGVMIAVMIALPWNLYELIAHHDRFVNDVVVKHLFSRTTSALEGHVGNYYFYLRTLINKFHPWILVGIFSAPYCLYLAIKNWEDEFIFVSAWIFVIFIIITLIRTKLPWYVFPIYPALSLTIGFILAKIFREKYVLWIYGAFTVIMILHIPFSHIFSADYSRGIKALAPTINGRMPKKETIYFYKYHDQPAGVFYLERRVNYADTPAEFMDRSRQANFYCVVPEKDLAEVQGLFKPARLGVLASQEGLVFVGPTKA